jgi:hypothetical protein
MWMKNLPALGKNRTLYSDLYLTVPSSLRNK